MEPRPLDQCHATDTIQTEPPGGSSTGSAAVVADGHSLSAFSTQTGGSIIRSTSFNGIYAATFMFDIVLTEGQEPFAPSFDRSGFFTKDSYTIGLILYVL